MLSELNIMKPMNSSMYSIAKKCGWKNLESIPVRKNILPDSFVGTAKLEPYVTTIGTKLNKNNISVMEIILGNDKISKSPFVRSNMTEILTASNTKKDSLYIQKMLTPETIDKLDSIREIVKRHPNDYIKDKSVVKYIATPAGLNSLFKDLSLLKAAYVFDKDALIMLFKMDITRGKGLKILESVGEKDLSELDMFRRLVMNPEHKFPAEKQLVYFTKKV